jgi:hypothetical protein
MPTAQNISNIKSKLLNPALTSLYYVTVGKPQGAGINDFLTKNLGSSVDEERLNLMCCEATLPGSNLATLELTNDHTGVTERHAYRRVYDDRIDLTFYVDAENYVPIRFFETWIKYIAQESIKEGNQGKPSSLGKNYFYSFQYPDSYISDQGLTVVKFEKSSLGYEGRIQSGKAKKGGQLKYTFIRSFPISISSMPVSYDTSNLLKCTVSMSYIRYVVDKSEPPTSDIPESTPQESQADLSGFNLTGTNQTGNVNYSNLKNYDVGSLFTMEGQARLNSDSYWKAGLPASGPGTKFYTSNFNFNSK